jgi:hypothetical protein
VYVNLDAPRPASRHLLLGGEDADGGNCGYELTGRIG